jgi:hypothetical protein
MLGACIVESRCTFHSYGHFATDNLRMHEKLVSSWANKLLTSTRRISQGKNGEEDFEDWRGIKSRVD